MKLKASLLFGVLVLALCAIGISPAYAAAPAGVSAAPSPFLCSLNQSTTPQLPKIEPFLPPPVQETFPPLCGSCSDFVCQGRSVNAPCGGTSFWCYDFGGTCHTPDQVRCRCSDHVP